MISTRKGAALPGAIILCTLIIIVSLGLASVLLNISASNIVHKNETMLSLKYQEAFNNFKKDASDKPLDTSSISWKIYEKDTNIHALCAYQGEDLVFCGIYDHTEEEVLTYQESNFYILSSEGASYWSTFTLVVEE